MVFLFPHLSFLLPHYLELRKVNFFHYSPVNSDNMKFSMKHYFLHETCLFLNLSDRIKPVLFIQNRSPLFKMHEMPMYTFMQFSHKCSKLYFKVSVNAFCCELLL